MGIRNLFFMTASTHIAFGLLSAAGAFSLTSVPLHQDVSAVGGAILGSLLPDIDSPKSSIGRMLPFVSAPIEQRWGHRAVTHSLLALLALGLVTLPLFFYWGSCFTALLTGYASHLFADCATKSGVPLFYPNPAVCVFPANDRYRIRTGSLVGEGLVLVLLLILLAVSMPVLRVGGIWRAVRYLIASQRTAYADYREAASEAVLSFEGRWRESRRPVRGEALILDATSGRLLIAFEGRVLTVGEEGDILSDKSRVRETGRPIRLSSLRVRGKTFEEILAQVPEGAFVSGRLEGDASVHLSGRKEVFQARHVCVRASGRTLELTFVPRSALARLAPRRQVDAGRITELRAQIGGLASALQAMQLKRPPVHYLKLRETREELEAGQRELAGLREPTVRFTGLLSLRIPGGVK